VGKREQEFLTVKPFFKSRGFFPAYIQPHTSGLLNLNQKTLLLTNTAYLNNENENSRLIRPMVVK